jgi:hypothetical protein
MHPQEHPLRWQHGCVREGVGVESSLRRVAGRFAERAVEDFFAGSERREFVIDAASSVEFAAKGLIARHAAPKLYDVKDSPPLSDDELYVIAPDRYPDRERPGVDQWTSAFNGLLRRTMIAGRDAAARAAKLAMTHDHMVVDVAAANRLFDARNAAIHIGDIDESEMNRLAKDFLKAFTGLSAALYAPGVMLFGNLATIANPKHMKVDRSPKVDAHVQVVLAYRRFHFGVARPPRRSALAVAGDTTRCPACDQRAHVTIQQPHDVLQHRVSLRERSKPAETLDCLYCGLTVYGHDQIAYAQHEFPGFQDVLFDPLDGYR